MRHLEILRLLKSAGGNNQLVRSRARRTGMAGGALQRRDARAGVIGKEEGIAARGRVATNDAGGVSSIKVLVRVGLKIDCVDEVAVSVHIGRRQSISAQQRYE